MAAIWTQLYSFFLSFLFLLQETIGSGYVWIYALILLAVVVYTIFQLKRQVGDFEDKRKSQLKKRFKNGEISRETYEAEKKELEL